MRARVRMADWLAGYWRIDPCGEELGGEVAYLARGGEG